MRSQILQGLALCLNLLAAGHVNAKEVYHKVDSPGPDRYCCSECVKRNTDGVCTSYAQCRTGTTNAGAGACNFAVNPVLPGIGQPTRPQGLGSLQEAPPVTPAQPLPKKGER